MARIGYVSDDYRHIVNDLRQPLMLITAYKAEGKSAVITAVDDQGKRWHGVAGVQPNARVTMRESRD
jgi:hypothetical protein